MKKHNFNAGPAILPEEVIREAAEAVKDYNGIGMSLLEMSHRSKEFGVVIDESVSLVKELLSVPDDYAVLFLQGGASQQFCQIPYNLLDNKDTAAYLETGMWAKKAIKEAKFFGNVEVVASSADSNFNFIPKGYSIPDYANYFHVTSNNTIFGTQLHKFPVSPVPLVADMSSDIFSRPFDITRFSLVYAGAQKNMGPAGVTLVIVKNDVLGKVSHNIPTILDYRTHIEKNSLYHTPPVFSIYVSCLTMKWIKSKGGVAAVEKANHEKAKKLYNEIDKNEMFIGTAVKEDRSVMNVPFVLKNPELDQKFLDATIEAGIVGIKGHRSVGGFRASLYNALPMESVDVLVDLMHDFGLKNS